MNATAPNKSSFTEAANIIPEIIDPKPPIALLHLASYFSWNPCTPTRVRSNVIHRVTIIQFESSLKIRIKPTNDENRPEIPKVPITLKNSSSFSQLNKSESYMKSSCIPKM